MLPHSSALRARLLQVRSPIVTFCSSERAAGTDTHTHPLSPDNIFSEESRQGCMLRFRQVKNPRRPEAPAQAQSDGKQKQAAVLVPLCVAGPWDEVSLLYTLRSPSLTTHRGQVAFPGGMRDEADENFEATAIRETEEELGIPRQGIQVWGSSISPLPSQAGVAVVPVVASLGIIDLKDLRVNHQEVGEVFTIPLHHLCKSENFRHTQFRNGYVLPVYLGGKHRVWGLTAVITHMFLRSLLPSFYERTLHPIKLIQTDTVS